MRTIVNVINQQSDINVKTLSDIACIGKRQLNRLFLENIGISPKEFTRIIRFQKSLYFLQTDSNLNLTDVTQLLFVD